MSSLLSSVILFSLIAFVSSAPVETTTELPVEQTTFWVPNADVRKHIELINEFVRVREEVLSSTELTELTTDDEMIPMVEITEGIENAQALIHKFFAVVKDLETKKKEYEMMTTTTVAPTTAPKGFFGKLFQSSGLRKLFD